MQSQAVQRADYALSFEERAREMAIFFADVIEAGARRLGPRNPSTEGYLRLAAELRAQGAGCPEVLAEPWGPRSRLIRAVPDAD